MTQQYIRLARVYPGPRPTLPPGGRMGEVSPRTRGLDTAIASLRVSRVCAHPGSVAALFALGEKVNRRLNRLCNPLKSLTPENVPAWDTPS